MSTTLLSILQHSLGRDEYGQTRSRSGEPGDFRNHFCTGPGSKDFALCREAVEQGLMTEHPPSQLSGGDSVFTVTAAGKRFVDETSPKRPPEPKMTRSQKRYREFLAADSDMSFREWLGIRAKPRVSGAYDYSRGFLASDLCF